MDVALARCNEHVIDAGVRHLSDQGVRLDQVQIFKQRPTPLFGFAFGTVPLDYLLKRIRFGHQLTPWLGEPFTME
jgi:hypothetical protein